MSAAPTRSTSSPKTVPWTTPVQWRRPNRLHQDLRRGIEAWDLAGDRRFLSTRPDGNFTGPGASTGFSPDARKAAYVQWAHGSGVKDSATGPLGPVVNTPMHQGGYLDVAWHPDSTIST